MDAWKIVINREIPYTGGPLHVLKTQQRIGQYRYFISPFDGKLLADNRW
jgi:hypothetical protein